jgi:hypothetical protein
MASKGGRTRQEKRQAWIDSIETTKILRRVNKHTLAKSTDADYEQSIMTASQIKAAELLLRKTIPDLKAIEATVDANLNVITPVLPDYLKDAD